MHNLISSKLRPTKPHDFTARKLCVAIASTATLALAGCGGTGQDDHTPSVQSTTFTGVVVDGALARATVYLDSNNNGTRDPWESYAFTDNEGYYSFNPKTGVDYCASTTPESQQIYCLMGNTNSSNVVVRIDGGYDLLTGEPFLGQMSRRVNVTESTSTIDSVISPLTTLLTNVEDTQSQTNVLTALGITENELDINYIDTDGNGGIHARLLNTSLKVHKTVTILSDRLNDNYPDLSEEIGVMNDPSSEVYKNLALELSSNTQLSIDSALRDTSSLTRIMDESERVLRNLYEQKELTLPSDLGSVESPQNLTRIVEVASNIPRVTDQLLNSTELTLEQAIGGARALETLVIKSNNEGQSVDSSIDAAISFLSDDTNDLVAALTEALASDLADVSTLSQNDFSGSDFDSIEEVAAASVLPEDTRAFTTVANTTLKVSDLDLGRGPDRLNDQEVEFYFLGDSNSIDGSLQACVKFIEDAHEDGTLSEGSSRGELVYGFWSMLGANENNQSSYSILLTIEFLGATYQAILKQVGEITIEETTYHQIRFDNSGEYRVWHSAEGSVTTEVIPTSNSECETRLPSRIGI